MTEIKQNVKVWTKRDTNLFEEFKSQCSTLERYMLSYIESIYSNTKNIWKLELVYNIILYIANLHRQVSRWRWKIVREHKTGVAMVPSPFLMNKIKPPQFRRQIDSLHPLADNYKWLFVHTLLKRSRKKVQLLAIKPPPRGRVYSCSLKIPSLKKPCMVYVVIEGEVKRDSQISMINRTISTNLELHLTEWLWKWTPAKDSNDLPPQSLNVQKKT